MLWQKFSKYCLLVVKFKSVQFLPNYVLNVAVQQLTRGVAKLTKLSYTYPALQIWCLLAVHIYLLFVLDFTYIFIFYWPCLWHLKIFVTMVCVATFAKLRDFTSNACSGCDIYRLTHKTGNWGEFYAFY